MEIKILKRISFSTSNDPTEGPRRSFWCKRKMEGHIGGKTTRYKRYNDRGKRKTERRGKVKGHEMKMTERKRKVKGHEKKVRERNRTTRWQNNKMKGMK